MHACTLDIAIDNFVPGQYAWYREGQLIHGTVHVRVTRRMSAALRVDQSVWDSEGYTVVVRSIVLAKGTWEHGDYRFRFTFSADGGPQTLPQTSWILNAVVFDVWTDFRGMMDRFGHPIPPAWCGYTQVLPGAPPPRPPVLQVDSESEKKAKTAIFAVYGVILMAVTAVFGIREIDFEASPALKLGAIFGMIGFMLSGALALTITYVKYRSRRRLGPSRLSAPQALPAPEVRVFPDDASRPQPSEGGSDATGQ